ncbi:MAG TPA: START domain-containing protein [Chitinophagales bacterium]|nr:START domain-containing protein [Chitinophagales bacterium]
MKTLYATLFSFLAFASILMAQGQWDLVKDKDGIKVFNRKMEGSKLKEFKGNIQFKASVNDVVKFLSNHTNHDKFMYKAKKGSVEIVKKDPNGDFYTYMIIETPWPASNRDLVTLYHKEAPDKDGTVVIKVSAVNDIRPHTKGNVRVENMKGYWKISPLPGGMVDVTHQAYSSPGGNVPEGLANSASVNAPFEMLENLRKLF